MEIKAYKGYYESRAGEQLAQLYKGGGEFLWDVTPEPST